jgi:hypothetical protein
MLVGAECEAGMFEWHDRSACNNKGFRLQPRGEHAIEGFGNGVKPDKRQHFSALVRNVQETLVRISLKSEPVGSQRISIRQFGRLSDQGPEDLRFEVFPAIMLRLCGAVWNACPLHDRRDGLKRFARRGHQAGDGVSVHVYRAAGRAEMAAVTSISTSMPGRTRPATSTVERTGRLGWVALP